MNRIDLKLNDELNAALEAYADECGMSKGSAAAAIIAAALGIEYIAPKHGGWRGNPASIEALARRADELTDKGRNDPAE